MLSLGVYWTAWGWQFALGIILSIYVHEMGHVFALHRYGFKAAAPMFVPGVGALVRLQQPVTNTREDADIGLAGPIYGLGAALFAGATGAAGAQQQQAPDVFMSNEVALPPVEARAQVKTFIEFVRQLGALNFEANFGVKEFRYDIRLSK